MKIDKIQINDFGRFSNKEIEFKDRINIIKGNNEAGKSTIQKFIVSMFYGISNDKRKSSFTDYDKYYPWGKESFSGKLNYTLDNGEKFEIYRDFTKKMPILYNNNAEDITKKYNSTKSKGSSFFEEQTGIDELTMTSSIVTEQGNVIVDQDSENFMIQKIANMAETGDEKISYEKAQSFLTKKRNEEVGTEKTKNRPINIINKEKRDCLEEKNELEQYNDEKYEIEERVNDIKAKNKENSLLLKFANEYKTTIDKVEDIRNKADIYIENKKNNIREKEEIEDRKKTIEEELEIARKEYDELTKKEEEEKNKRNLEEDRLKELYKKRKRAFLCLSILLLIASVIFIIVIYPVGIIGLFTTLISIIIGIVSNKKIKYKIDHQLEYEEINYSNEKKEEIESIERKLKEEEIKLEIISKNNSEIDNRISEYNIRISELKKEELKELMKKYSGISENYNEIIKEENLKDSLRNIENKSNEYNLELQKYEYRKKYIMPKIERIAELQERLYEIEEKEKELEKESKAISIASDVLKDSYDEMKKFVLPKFTDDLSKTISKITNDKYKKVVTNDKEGLIIEKENGEYVPAKALSIGTIDQLYLSLRFAIAEKTSKEVMPIILDESFAYYDTERLNNILKYIYDEFKNRQIILFTCTSREIEQLDKMKIEYSLIEL